MPKVKKPTVKKPKVKKPPTSERREKFKALYLADPNGAKAARDAGFSIKGAKQVAHRLLTDVDLQASLAKQKEAAAEKAGFTLQWPYEMLKKAADLALLPTHNQYGVTSNGDVRGLVAVMDIKNKMNGHYEAAKSEVTTEINNDGLKELVNELKKGY